MADRFDHLRQNLLDLSMRNQLLNFRPGKRSVKVEGEISDNIYETLVLKEKNVRFLQRQRETGNEEEDSLLNGENSSPKKTDSKVDSISTKEISSPKKADSTKEDSILNKENSPLTKEDSSSNTEDSTLTMENASSLTEEEAEILWELPEEDVKVSERRRRLFLQTDLVSTELQKRLRSIFQRSKSVFEEQGYNILYLTLGFLEWKESSTGTLRTAPLILIPVTLTRNRVGSPFMLSWTGEDILTNISLKSKLEEQGIVLPDFEMPSKKEGISEYIDAVKKTVSRKKGWNIMDEIYLSFFSFTKFVMFQDLDPNNWPKELAFHKNTIIKDLFDPEVDETALEGFSENEVDRKLKSKEVFNVLDADSSQIAVIEDIKAGRNLVVEGPPGTGKSQTIVNLIAELMASGKTVLFVSEKMAALEVVKSRLDKVGLGEFCLELHSHKSNKKDVLAQLQRTLYQPAVSPLALEHKYDELDLLKYELDLYTEIIHQPIGKTGFSTFDLYGMKEDALQYFQNKQMEIPYVTIKDVERVNSAGWSDSLVKLGNISELLKPLLPLSQHPWRFAQPDAILPSDENEIKSLLNQSKNTIKNIEKSQTLLSELSGVSIALNRNELDEYLEYAQMIGDSEKIPREVLDNPVWDGPEPEAEEILRNLKELEIKTKNFNPQILDKNLIYLLDNFKSKSSKHLKFFSGDYKKRKKEIQSLYMIDAPEVDETLIGDLENLIECQNIRNELNSAEFQAKNYFGPQWKGTESRSEDLYNFYTFMRKLRKILKEGKISENSLDIISRGPDKKNINRIVKNIRKQHEKLQKTMEDLQNILKIDMVSLFKTDVYSVKFVDLISQMEIFKDETPKLILWSQFLSVKRDMPHITEPIIDLVERDLLDPDDIIPAFKANFADNILKLVFREVKFLSSFVGDVHQNKIQKFQDLDRELLILNRKRIAHLISVKRPGIQDKISPNSELGILLSEFNRRRRHMPIRKLLSEAGGLIQQIKPCFMMSPLSVAQFIDPHHVGNLMFDVIVFDEASQVKPEDALGAFLRGKKLVVMGDTRQLPPTSFFDSMVDLEKEEDYEITSLKDMESILHLCKSSFPSKMLRWHYRSRHESLIAVSNEIFYDNQLLVYPSPSINSKDLGLKFYSQPESVYAGQSSGNTLEAKSVVNEVIEHFKKYGNSKSLGVGTFNQNQRRLIEDFLEIELKKNPDIEKYFVQNNFEKFFVKNLETIQGDERDVIFVSVGFGFDSNHKLSQNFGPINNDGGERRLNVLFTRAREKCVVFSNFKYSDLKVGKNAPRGLRALKSFLRYAETQELEAYTLPGADSDSLFEDSVFEFLSEQGFEIHRQVGCAGFRIDLAIVDQKSPGKYLLGIECDGATYHSSMVARDRDRLRQQVLEGLGWKIYRVWSTDWFRNRGETTRRLLEAIQEAEEVSIMEEKSETAEITAETENVEIITESELTEVSAESELINESADEEAEITLLSMDQLKEPVPQVSLEDSVLDYEECTSLDISKNSQLHEKSPLELAQVIVQIVDMEGPVHIEEVIKRIRNYWGLKKSGRRIRDIINSAVTVAEQDGEIYIKGDFLYSAEAPVKVRRHPSANIDLISPEEIENAIKLIIESQFATPSDDLIVQSARLMGFKSTRKKTADKIREVLDSLIETNELMEMPNGMINFAK